MIEVFTAAGQWERRAGRVISSCGLAGFRRQRAASPPGCAGGELAEAAGEARNAAIGASGEKEAEDGGAGCQNLRSGRRFWLKAGLKQD